LKSEGGKFLPPKYTGLKATAAAARKAATPYAAKKALSAKRQAQNDDAQAVVNLFLI
jgi:hypothetical protein